MRNTSLVIFLLATIALTLIVPAVSGISLLQQQAMAATNGQNGRPGTNACSAESGCRVGGGTGGMMTIGRTPSTATEEMGALQMVNVSVYVMLLEEMAVMTISIILVIH